MHDEKQGNTHTISTVASLLGAVRRVLPDAVPPLEPALQPLSYGWITGACAEPAKGDHYIVEFLSKREYRMLAYIDRHGRVFSVDGPITSPPAREPDLCFARFTEQPVPGEQQGTVEVLDAKGTTREVAQYVCKRNQYTLFDTWYQFGSAGANLSYDDALARAYLAFVYRPKLNGSEVPARGIGLVSACLRSENLLAGLKELVESTRAAELDPWVSPPALVRSVVRWLGDAGIDALLSRKIPSDTLRLVRTVRYANTFFIALNDDQKVPVSRREVWALESALNRFLLVEEAFGDRASLANDADCARWDTYLIETVGMRAPSVEHVDGQPVGVEGGEWETRCRIGAALERLKLPVRIEAQMRVVVAEGIVALDLTVPDGLLMPTWRWVDGSTDGWVAASEAERDAQARRYAMHVGLVLASAAFEASPAIQRVEVTARPLAIPSQEDGLLNDVDDEPGSQAAEFPPEQEPAYFQVSLTRQMYDSHGAFREVAQGDPTPLLAHVGAAFDVTDANPFASTITPYSIERALLPEAADAALSAATQSVLGVEEASGLRIVANAYQRRIGEGLADGIVCAASTTEAIRLVREVQDAAEARCDDRVAAACTHLMAALAEGSLDAGDQNAVVGCFLGEDRCLTALGRARGLAQIDPDQAVSVLMDAVAEAAALDGFVDSPTTVYRSFESYATRVLYNRAVALVPQEAALGVSAVLPAVDVPTLVSCAASDRGKRLVMTSDSFYLCHLEIISLLERSFERIDDAMRYGRRAVEMAPSTAAGYRQLGRAFMLVGDMDNAAAVLEAGLRVAIQPNDIAAIYYQLAYALWKAGRPREGAACYVKSVIMSPVFGLQAMTELKELVTEHDVEPVERGEVDEVLRSGGVVVAPTDEVLETLDSGAAAATDAGLLPVARNLLSLRLRYRPDDALVNVLGSLDVTAS